MSPLSTFEKVKVAVWDETAPVGPESIVGATGATVSTVHTRVVVSDGPAGEVARTRNVCSPSARPV